MDQLIYTMDQIICASLSHNHYWYEVGMLKAPYMLHELYCISGTVCVVIPFILDVRFVDVPARVTQDFSTFLLRCVP